MELIDIIGGVEIEISEAERKVINDYVKELNWINNDDLNKDILDNSGLVKLNGKQALCYARIRYVGNADFERTERQREVLFEVAFLLLIHYQNLLAQAYLIL